MLSGKVAMYPCIVRIRFTGCKLLLFITQGFSSGVCYYLRFPCDSLSHPILNDIDKTGCVLDIIERVTPGT